ncbi:MAG: RNA-binding domain-containing protein [Halolamina sp.]
MIYSVDVTIEVPVKPTEVPDRVEDAVTNLFPDADFRREPDRFVAEAHSLDAFSDVLHEQEILDTARREFFNGMDEDGFAFSLKKQPAFEGVVNFAVGSVDELGDIDVRVDVREPDVESFIDHVAPPTEEGRPIDPDDH